MKDFLSQVVKFNEMYKIQRSNWLQMPTEIELRRFKSILQEELDELNELIQWREKLGPVSDIDDEQTRCFMVELADWHGDMIVYPHTHADRFGFPMDKILNAIMQSNFSKLDADGQPIYDDRGKVIKGPHFVPPESSIHEILFGTMPNPYLKKKKGESLNEDEN